MKFCSPRRFGLYFVIAIAIFVANQSGETHAQSTQNPSIYGNLQEQMTQTARKY